MASPSKSFTPGRYHSVPVVPPQKRSPRACDQCRERKTKCEASPHGRCEGCVKASLPCSYVRRSSSSRTSHAPGGTHVSHLEPRVCDPPRLGSAPRTSSQSPSTTTKLNLSNWTSDIPSDATISAIGSQLNPSPPNFAPPKHYSLLGGLGVLRRIHEVNHQSSSYVSVLGAEYQDLATVLDQNVHSYVLFGSEASHLPPKDNLLQWIDCSLLNCPWLDHIITRPKIERDIERLYTAQDFGKVVGDRDRLALIYAVLALGQRYQNAYGGTSQATEPPFSRGLQAFSAAREIVNPTHFDRSLSALASGAAMSLYLASYSAQTTAHIYTSNVAAAALRLGLHEDIANSAIPESERETMVEHDPCSLGILCAPCTRSENEGHDRIAIVCRQLEVADGARGEQFGSRRRLFSAIAVMDACASSSLGLPSTLRAAGHCPGAEQDTISSIPEAYLWLLSVLNEAAEQAARAKFDSQTGSRLMSVSSLQATGSKLDAWSCQESAFSANEQLRSPFQQQGTLLLLEYTATYVQMLIYSPFLHHITNAATDHSFYATAAAIRCLDAAVWAIELAELLEVRNCFEEAYPLTTQALVCATTILLNVQLYSSNAIARQKSAWGCPKAIALLDRLATRSYIAAGCLACLKPLYEPRTHPTPTISTTSTTSSTSSFSSPPPPPIPNNMATTDDIVSMIGQYPDPASSPFAGMVAAGQTFPIPRSTSTVSDPTSATMMNAGRSASYDFGA